MAYETQQAVREEAGLQSQVLAEQPSGTVNSSNTAFVTNFKPLVDRTYSDSVTTADLTAYVNSSSVAITSIVAATGTVTLTAAPTTGTTVTIDYAYSPLQDTYVANVIAEAQDFIDTKMQDLDTVPYTTVPATIRKICRVYAAGLILTRDYGFQADTEGTSKDGYRKIKLAEEWLTAYYDTKKKTGTTTDRVQVTNDGFIFSARRSSDDVMRPLDENFSWGSDESDGTAIGS